MTVRGLADTSVFIARESGRPVRTQDLPQRLAVSVVTVAELRELFTTFSDPEMKEHLVFVASQRSDREAVDFLMEIAEDDVRIEHEARVSKLADEQLFYLQSRGIDVDQARLMIVNGFIEPFVRELPMEYAVEMNRLIELEMEGSVG